MLLQINIIQGKGKRCVECGHYISEIFSIKIEEGAS